MKSRKKIVVAGIHNGFQSIGSSTTSLELARPGIDIGPISFCSLRTRPLFVFGSKLLWFPPHPNDKQDPRDGNDYKRRPRFHSWRDCASCCFSDAKSHRFSGYIPNDDFLAVTSVVLLVGSALMFASGFHKIYAVYLNEKLKMNVESALSELVERHTGVEEDKPSSSTWRSGLR